MANPGIAGAVTAKSENKKKAVLTFLVTLIIAILVFGASVVKTSVYNHQKHHAVFEGAALLSPSVEAAGEVSAKALPRSSTWTKCFDFYNEGLTEHNYQAYTYDVSITNNTRDEVSEFTFKLTFSQDVYLMSAWNGALEIHQQVAGGELVAAIPDLRDFDAGQYDLRMFSVDGEDLVAMKPGDYFVYYPSTSMNALEMPLKPSEGTVPGMILYAAIGEDIDAWSLELYYTFHRLLTSEPLFWIALIGAAVWLIALLIFIITSVQIRQYQERHKRDNEIINESIETFTGFIDAKDPYTNGHSKRVAVYTRQIAKEFGYEGEELDRIYYIALLHDCGKIGVPDNILGKPGKLTDEEFKIIKSHTIRGGEILNSFKSLENAGEGALYHHERYDGKGYPEGRTGEEIPLIARMICVADSFDAMNTNRVYRKMLTEERILSEIETNKGCQFDPKIADAMLRLLREGKIKM
jgi:hypothetical protein